MEKNDEIPTHVTGVVVQHNATPNPTNNRTIVHVTENQAGKQYVSLSQSKDEKHKINFFTEDWEFVRKQVDELIGKKRLLK